jgi:hypothetical protein
MVGGKIVDGGVKVPVEPAITVQVLQCVADHVDFLLTKCFFNRSTKSACPLPLIERRRGGAF